MKKIFSKVVFVAAAAMTFFSCQKSEVLAPVAEEVVLTFASDKPAFADETKTEWTGSDIHWSKGDKIAVAYTVNGNWQNATGNASGDAKLYKSEDLKAAAQTAQFNVSTYFKGTTEGEHVFYGVYPAPSETGFASAPVATVTVASIQNPKADSFDSNADLMVGVSGKYDSRPAEGENISLKWNRLVAHAVITLKDIKGLTAQETIENITLTAQDAANLVGQQKVNLITKEVVKDNASANVLKIGASKLTVNAGSVTFWAAMLPETITSLTVEVETDKATYTRQITGVSKTFKQNARNTLAIKMDTATRIEKAVDNSFVVDVLNREFTEVSGTDYISWSNKTSVSDAVYAGQSAGGNEAIQLRSNNSNSGIVTTTSGGLVKEVSVKWNSNTYTGRTLNVYGSSTAYTNPTDLYQSTKQGILIGTIVCGSSTKLVIDGDYEYVGMRSASGAMYIDEITISWSTAGVVPDTTPSVELETEELELPAAETEGTIAVTVKNISDVRVTALVEEGTQDEVDWLTVDYADGLITYTAEANASEDERTAYIEVYCLDAQSNELVAGVNVTQKGKIVVDTNFEAGDYWIIGVEDGTSHVMLPLASTATYGYASSAVINDNRSFAKNAFTFEAVEGGFAIKDSDGKYYGTGASYKSFQITSAVWTVTVKDDGTYMITDASTGKTIKYGDGTYTTFGVYAESDTNTGVCPILVKADNPIAVELSSIVVSGATTSYNIDDTFEFDGTVTATYNDGSTKTVTPTSVSDPDMSAAGTQTVTVSYTEGTVTRTAEYTINIIDPNAGGGDVAEPVTETITFDANKTQRTSFSSKAQVWKSGNVTFTNDKASSSNDVADYSNPVRLYQGSAVTIAATGSITEIVIVSDGTSKYKTALQDSLTGAGYTYTNSGNNYTVTISGESSVTFSLTAQARFKSVSVTYN